MDPSPSLSEQVPRPSISPVPEIDQEILLNLKYPEIINACQTNRHLSNFCQDERFWKEKALRDYPELLEYKPENVTYRTFLHTIHNRDIYSSIQQGGLYLLIHMAKRPWWTVDPSWLTEAVIYKQLPILKWLVEKGGQLDDELFYHALIKNDLETVKWIAERIQIPADSYAQINRGKFGRSVADWLFESGVALTNQEIMIAAIFQNLDFLDWVISKDLAINQNIVDLIFLSSLDSSCQWFLDHEIYPSDNVIDEIIRLGYYGLFNMLLSKGKLPSSQAIFDAILDDDLRLLKRLDSLGVKDAPYMKELALIRGNPEILAWLKPADDHFYTELGTKLTREYISDIKDANLAAANGYLDLLEEFSLQGIKPNHRGLHGAIINNHVEVVNWIFKYQEIDNFSAFLAVEYNRDDILKMLSPSQEFLNELARKGNLVMIKWYNDNLGILPGRYGSALAIKFDHNEIVKYLFSKGIWPPYSSVVQLVAQRKVIMSTLISLLT